MVWLSIVNRFGKSTYKPGDRILRCDALPGFLSEQRVVPAPLKNLVFSVAAIQRAVHFFESTRQRVTQNGAT